MPGPLPDPNAVRRNAPTVPTTSLASAGRAGPAPAVPAWIELGESGSQWWVWAWSTPQALGWGVSAGMEVVIARRASLEDELAGAESGRLQLQKEMRELDDRLGLTPKGLAALRWVIVPEAAAAAPTVSPDEIAAQRSRRARLASGE